MEIFVFMLVSNFELLLKSLKAHSLFDANLASSEYLPIDLSIHNSELKNIKDSSSRDLEYFIWNDMKKHKAKTAYGGYLEKRSLYQRSIYFNQTNGQSKGQYEEQSGSRSPRNIHLGLDLWIEANTPILAPLDGTIHSFKNNTNHGDYGPTIILKHEIEDFTFYTLYGHLSLEAIVNLKVGVEVRQGQRIATLGTAEVNGDYPPHLHFQVIKDIEGYYGDYPGVCSMNDLEYYKQNCPDPYLLLKF